MPIYEYDCAACHEHIEIRASMTAHPGELTCPSCGSADVRRDYGGIALLRSDRGTNRGPRPGELRPADPRRLTKNVATSYANWTGDGVMREVAQRVDRGAEPDQLHDFVREVKAQREVDAGRGAKVKRGAGRGRSAAGRAGMP